MSIIDYGVSKHYAGSQVSDPCPLGYLFKRLDQSIPGNHKDRSLAEQYVCVGVGGGGGEWLGLNNTGAKMLVSFYHLTQNNFEITFLVWKRSRCCHIYKLCYDSHYITLQKCKPLEVYGF